MPVEERHKENAARAKALYVENLRPELAARDWRHALDAARQTVAAALVASNNLADMQGALEASGRHSVVFRQLLAPPLSQDQFKLVCPAWSKGAENGARSVPTGAAFQVAGAILARLDHHTVRWDVTTETPLNADLEVVLKVVGTLLAVQQVATAQRGRLAAEQEGAVVSLLTSEGWTRLPSRTIDERAAVPPRHFMRKTRFATATTAHQEVDIACGLKASYVLAMECKVTNDETNSVKRINDVLKKAAAWRYHWGAFVHTAALLQGVVAPKDVQRLTDAGVKVFWSHDLEDFLIWLNTKL